MACESDRVKSEKVTPRQPKAKFQHDFQILRVAILVSLDNVERGDYGTTTMTKTMTMTMTMTITKRLRQRLRLRLSFLDDNEDKVD